MIQCLESFFKIDSHIEKPEFQCVFSQSGFCNHTFCVSMADLAVFFERFEGPDLDRLLGPEDTVFRLSPAHLHRHLWHSRPSQVRVTDIANDWGFWHMGQFAADYRELFGELPSQTLKRDFS